MSWDLALEGESGDLIFSPTLDLLGATGDGLTKQRVLIRCRIPRGSWTYDLTGELGSRLATISRNPGPIQLANAPAMVKEALAPMEDITVDDVQATVDENNRLVVSVSYTPVLTQDEADAIGGVSADIPVIDATVTI
ncbi:MAG TPA: hypothetical protein VN039_06580 [Nitrospira sp.]|nr:hypothetical protein [Nitrospira sp.]